MKTLKINNIEVGGGINSSNPLAIIAGPCAIESREQCLLIGQTMKNACDTHGFSYVFKGSFDKANRTSIRSARGLGIDEGLAVLESVGKELGVPTTTDLHESSQAQSLGQVVDIIQIPAFLCRQTDLLVAAAKTGKVVNVKKGQFLSPVEMENVVQKLEESNVSGIMLTERGTFFGYNRLVNDFIGIGDMIDSGYPVCFDVTHSTQQPGGQGTKSGGRPDKAPLLARAAVAAGVDALFIEAHPNPSEALSDGATMLTLQAAVEVLAQAKAIRQALGG